MTHLPWGHMITVENLHVQLACEWPSLIAVEQTPLRSVRRYLPFAIEHWELLRSCAPRLRKQQLDMQEQRQQARRSHVWLCSR